MKRKESSLTVSTAPPFQCLQHVAGYLSHQIASSSHTAFEKRVWSALCQVPRGHFTTYGLLAAHLKSSPRAVGNALRRNPFSPDVPCHRVVATGGALCGFKGRREGNAIKEKRSLLRGEGVRLDLAGKAVIGTPFRGFV